MRVDLRPWQPAVDESEEGRALDLFERDLDLRGAGRDAARGGLLPAVVHHQASRSLDLDESSDHDIAVLVDPTKGAARTPVDLGFAGHPLRQ
ncbi:MAG: hypothetical protein M3067_04150 [Chloroflexota bacterium]|nr:hypothetical protein [Chloroflexota bacterium]